LAPGPPGDPILAVRAARRAVAANPNDPDVYYFLAQAYTYLLKRQETFWTGNSCPMLTNLRLIQIVTALERAALLRPDSAIVHRSLAETYQQLKTDSLGRTNYLDLEMDHWAAFLKLTKAAGAPKGQSQKDFQKQLTDLESSIKRRETAVKYERRRNDYDVAAQGKSAIDRAQLAYELGLVKEALDVLMALKPEDLEPKSQATNPGESRERQAQLLKVQLLITTGQVDKIRESDLTLAEDLKVQIAIALGDYRLADEFLEHMIQTRELFSTRNMLGHLQGLTFQGSNFQQFFALGQIVAGLREWADVHTVRGLMALEVGDNEQAAKHFRAALSVSLPSDRIAAHLAPPPASAVLEAAAAQEDDRQTVFTFSAQPIAYRYLQLLKAAGN
jgi:hypothetical protein